MVEIPEDELKSLKRQLMKLKLESKLRSNMSRELDRQKSIAEKLNCWQKKNQRKLKLLLINYQSIYHHNFMTQFFLERRKWL